MDLSWADHRRLDDAQPGMVKLPDGSLIMRGQKPIEAKPGMLAGLRQYFAEKLSPQPKQDQWWIPQPAPVAPVAVPAQPQPASSVPGSALLPQYNEWSAIEDAVAREQKIKDELGGVSKAVMESKPLIEGKWF